jgi:hypothetical protein
MACCLMTTASSALPFSSKPSAEPASRITPMSLRRDWLLERLG